MSKNRPTVLSFSGHDPSGGAGVQADIETFISHRCHACSVITVLTEQDSHNVKKIIPQQPQDIIAQAQHILNDFQVSAIKIGLIGHHEIAEAIYSILIQNPHIPVVLDPVLASGGGSSLATKQLISFITENLISCSTVLTPNSNEARILAKSNELSTCGQTLTTMGSKFVLITGAHEQSVTVDNLLFQENEQPETFSWDRLPETYHGSGCTLASAITALIAHGLDPFTAISEAQDYTWNSLANAYHPGKGQFNPDRLFWMESNT